MIYTKLFQPVKGVVTTIHSILQQSLFFDHRQCHIGSRARYRIATEGTGMRTGNPLPHHLFVRDDRPNREAGA